VSAPVTPYCQDDQPSQPFVDAYEMCCGRCDQGCCYVDEMTGETSEGWGWQRR